MLHAQTTGPSCFCGCGGVTGELRSWPEVATTSEPKRETSQPRQEMIHAQTTGPSCFCGCGGVTAIFHFWPIRTFSYLFWLLCPGFDAPLALMLDTLFYTFHIECFYWETTNQTKYTKIWYSLCQTTLRNRDQPIWTNFLCFSSKLQYFLPELDFPALILAVNWRLYCPSLSEERYVCWGVWFWEFVIWYSRIFWTHEPRSSPGMVGEV